MRRKIFWILFLQIILWSSWTHASEAQAQAEKQEQKQDPTDFRVYWRDGLRFETRDKSVQFALNGRTDIDWAFMEGGRQIENLFGDLQDGNEIRRARLELMGIFYEKVEFRLQYDFGPGEPQAKDVFLSLRSIPSIGNLRAGHFKEPFSLDEQTSAKFGSFLERALPNVFVPSRNVGISLGNHAFKERLTWTVGFFRESDDFGFSSGDENYAVTGRLTGLPWHEAEGERFLHLGIAYSRRNPNLDKLQFRQRPEAHLAPRFVDTKPFAAETLDLVGTEAALVYGPFSVQTEAIFPMVNTHIGPEPNFSGFYVQAHYFITGEHRNYRRPDAAFDRIKPNRNFRQGGGPGAWELTFRFSQLDLNHAPIAGGKLNDFTVGLNWHLNPYSRIMWNYVLAERLDVGQAHIFMMRFHFDF